MLRRQTTGRPVRSEVTAPCRDAVDGWIAGIGLDPATDGTPSLRRTKATIVDRKTGNLRAVQLLSGPPEIESTVRYLGAAVDDALEIAEPVDL